jgi:hypothetical protein
MRYAIPHRATADYSDIFHVLIFWVTTEMVGSETKKVGLFGPDSAPFQWLLFLIGFERLMFLVIFELCI